MKKRRSVEPSSPKVMREAELSPMVSEWLRSQGYSVYAEIGVWSPCDHIGVRWSDESIICVEMKMCCSWQVMRQARSHQRVTPLVYVATKSRPRQSSLDSLVKDGLGLLVSGQVVIEPTGERSIVPKYRDRILEKCRHAVSDEVGGLPTLKGDGPRIRCEARLREYLKDHPYATWKQIFAEVPNHYSSARSMAGVFSVLLRNHKLRLEQPPEIA